MSEYKKVIPCLDMKDGRVVKGIKFTDLKDAGDPVESAKKYCEMGADELCFLDISATNENRKTTTDIASKVAKAIDIPLTVGGGIRTIEDMEALFNAGIAKVSINSAAVKNPNLIKEATEKFGKDRVVVAIDVTREDGKYYVLTHGGEVNTKKDAILWAKEVESLGASALLPTSLDKDGMKDGYDLELIREFRKAVNIPIIASGGAGELVHFKEAILNGADAVLAASVFHFGEIKVDELKNYLAENGIKVRL
ncbi:MAG: imidazole glycerol phosphate synthase subunit HisF [Campylobacteraceae bacterium]|nr:imidazole glycerol phosphate synthase subunit HisF [Campylobacteraceae bacterium]